MREMLQQQSLGPDVWHARYEEHRIRATQLTERWQQKHMRGESDPIEDFLFNYYSYRPALLKKWHPGPAFTLLGSSAELEPFRDQRWYRGDSDGSICFDAAAFVAERGKALDYIEKLLGLLRGRTPKLGCFGLHEWAMVYRQDSDEIRHQQLPLRLGTTETNQVVEQHQIVCSHFDAYRFFTPDAAPLNALRPTREAQEDFEQPGCLHAGMDTYKWAVKLGPAVPGELLLDCFELARDIRYLDMQASPYDVSSLGFNPVRIETDEGKQQYSAAQAVFAERAQRLRQRLLVVIAQTRALAQQQDESELVTGQ